MPCGWEGNRRSGVALAMRHRLQWFIHMRAHGLRKGDEHPTYSPLYPHVCLRTSSVQSNLAESGIAAVRERRFTVPIYFTVEMDRQISARSAASLFLYPHHNNFCRPRQWRYRFSTTVSHVSTKARRARRIQLAAAHARLATERLV